MSGVADELDDEIYADAEEDAEGYDDEEPLYPRLYRTLYSFVPEGTTEMALEEDRVAVLDGRSWSRNGFQTKRILNLGKFKSKPQKFTLAISDSRPILEVHKDPAVVCMVRLASMCSR